MKCMEDDPDDLLAPDSVVSRCHPSTGVPVAPLPLTSASAHGTADSPLSKATVVESSTPPHPVSRDLCHRSRLACPPYSRGPGSPWPGQAGPRLAELPGQT